VVCLTTRCKQHLVEWSGCWSYDAELEMKGEEVSVNMQFTYLVYKSQPFEYKSTLSWIVITCLVFCVFIFVNNRSRQDMQILPFCISSKVFVSVFPLVNFIKAVLHHCLPYINRYCQLNHSGVHDLRDLQSIGFLILCCQGNMYCTYI
jgi:hypothetical protein